MRSVNWALAWITGIAWVVPSAGFAETKMVLDQPDQTFSKLISDSGTLAFSGEVTIDPLTPITNSGFDQAFAAGNYKWMLTPQLTDGFNDFLAKASMGSTSPLKFKGTIFTIDITHFNDPGNYNHSSANMFGGTPPTIWFKSQIESPDCDDPYGCFMTTSAAYTVNVIGQKSDAVPEPFTCALGVLGIGAFFRRRKSTR